MRSLILILLVSISMTKAFACGGPETTEADVRKSEIVKKMKAKFEAVAGEKLKLKEVIFSGSQILDVNMKPYMSAMCDANYIYVYFRSNDNKVVCFSGLESLSMMGIVLQKQSYYAGQCYLANGQVVGLEN